MPRAAKVGPGVHRRKDGRYVIDIRWRDASTGAVRRHQQVLPKGVGKEAATLRAAKLFSRALAGEDLGARAPVVAAPTPELPQLRTLGEAIDAHLEWAASYRRRTLEDREYITATLARHLGRDTPLAELTVPRIQAFVAARQKERTRRGSAPAPATINRGVALLRCIVNQEVEAERVPEEVAIRVRRVRLLQEPDGRDRYLRAGEEAKLRAALPRHLVPVMEVLLRTGARLGEIAKLRKEDVDLVERRITIRGTKSGRDRVLYLGDGVLEILRDAIDRSPADCDVVFPTPAGERYPVKSLSRAFSRAIKAAGLRDLHAHDLRHTAATRLARVAPLHVVQRQLGHADVSTTVRRYAHVQDDQLRDAAKVLDTSS